MSKLERTVKDLIIFYVKENYNKYLCDNNLKRLYLIYIILKKIILNNLLKIH